MLKCLCDKLNPVTQTDLAILFMRLGVGILTICHGIPKIIGGIETWTQLGSFVKPLGINFFPILWGLLGACIEFFGGIFLALGLFTRWASLALTLMMFVATFWHISRADSFNLYSFPLMLIFVYYAFVIMGYDRLSIDYYLKNKNNK